MTFHVFVYGKCRIYVPRYTWIVTCLDWEKLVRLLKFLNLTKEDVLTIEASDNPSITWYVDAAFAVHEDMKSHSGATMTLGKGMIISGSTKQKINTRSSTEAELVAIGGMASLVIIPLRICRRRTKNFARTPTNVHVKARRNNACS